MPNELGSVFFHGYVHIRENLQDNVIKMANLRRTFDGTTGTKIYFDEAADTGPADACQIKQRIDSYGFAVYAIAADLFTRTGRSPSPQEAVRISNDLAGASEDQIIAERLVAPRILTGYLLGRDLDRLREENYFDFDMECHDQTVVKNDDIFSKQAHAHRIRALDFWNQGDSRSAVLAYKEGSRLRIAAVKMRDEDTRKRLKGTVQKLARKDPSGALFLNFGGAHVPLFNNLSHDFRYEPVTFEKYLSPDLSRVVRRYTDSRGNPDIPDRDYLIDFLHQGVLDEVSYGRNIWNPRLLKGYVDFSTSVANFWASLEPDEIERAAGPSSLIDFMLTHPRGQEIEAYL